MVSCMKLLSLPLVLSSSPGQADMWLILLHFPAVQDSAAAECQGCFLILCKFSGFSLFCNGAGQRPLKKSLTKPSYEPGIQQYF